MALDSMILGFAGLALVSISAMGAAWLTFKRDGSVGVRRLRTAPSVAGAEDDAPAIRLRALGVDATEAAADPDARTSRLRQQLTWAGFRGSRAPQALLASKIALAVLAVAVFAVVNARRTEPFEMGLPIAAWLAGLGFFLPNLWLRQRVADRQAKLDRALPDALDLLVTCVEAGLGLDAALQRVADEIALAHPLLSAELRQVFLEVKAGIARILAFRRMAERTGAPELRALSATLAQTELFGTSVGAALRVQADGIRVRRMQRAEEKAAYISVKMSLPLVLFILPSLFAVVLGPAIVQIVEQLPSALGGR